ncbi:putative cell division control protein 6-like protein [Candidatus Nitrososphaera gargensis Ga9.2]|uniref:ORC1-type DNA replication protein n=2 Tax=Candidatus Nitrososphaera gargensis TaxID=497727 RepID=K0IN17_NITGG|nr:putative cell division control protein 6-like protein [Candidatus Nitrososphaera gargensis Ga9.2]
MTDYPYPIIAGEEMSESAIFHDRSKLSPRYVPEELPHRQAQIEQIIHVFSDAAKDPDRFPLTILQVVGVAGIGKTSTILRSSKIIEEQFVKSRLVLKTAYINLKLQGGNKYAIYRFLLERIAPELPAQGLSAEEMLRYLLRYLRENKQYALIIMDEIDYLIKTSKDTGIIYDLTRLNEFEPDKPCNVKGVVFIARSTEFYSRLDPAELSTLGRVPMEFHPYSIEQVSDILESRAGQAFNPKAIGSDVIDKVAEITASPEVNGDVRYALDLLLYAGNLAESQGTGRVTLDHVRKVHGQVHPSITTEEIEQLSKNHLVSLMALVRALKSKKKPYVELKDVRLYASELAERLGMKKIDVEDYLDDLKARRLVDIRSLKEIGLHGASLAELEPALMNRIKGGEK